jgi:hypothetical protein
VVHSATGWFHCRRWFIMSHLLQINELEIEQKQVHDENVRKFVAAICR